jgi:hypothetical protein
MMKATAIEQVMEHAIYIYISTFKKGGAKVLLPFCATFSKSCFLKVAF